MHPPNLRKWLGIELIEVSAIEKTVSTVGGGFAILALIAISSWALPEGGATALITSMGASAVLLFGVPHGQLSQPWPVIAGHGISALIGVACAQFIHQPIIAAACSVGLAIGAMQQLKCIHPPGGATAFTAVMGGGAIHQLGFGFVLFPVLTNALVLVLLAVLINYAFPWRRYPNAFFNRAAQKPPTLSAQDDSLPTHEDIIAAMRSLDSFVDVSEDELVRLIELLKSHPGKSP